MYAAGDPAGALPPFNLSCQVRRWRSYICAELAAEVRLDCWGAAARRSRNTEALLGFPCRLFLGGSADPFRQAFIRAAGIPCPGGCPLGFLPRRTCQTHPCPFFHHRYKQSGSASAMFFFGQTAVSSPPGVLSTATQMSSSH